jgi:hypothetical protein
LEANVVDGNDLAIFLCDVHQSDFWHLKPPSAFHRYGNMINIFNEP